MGYNTYMVLTERLITRESPIEVRDRVFGWVEENREEIIKLMEEDLERRRVNNALVGGLLELGSDGLAVRIGKSRVLSEMGICGVVNDVIDAYPLADFKCEMGRVFVYDEDREGWRYLFKHAYLVGPNDLVCCLTAGQFIFNERDLKNLGRGDGFGNCVTYFSKEKFGPGDRLRRLKELMPGAVEILDDGLGVLCASRCAVDQTLGLKFKPMD